MLRPPLPPRLAPSRLLRSRLSPHSLTAFLLLAVPLLAPCAAARAQQRPDVGYVYPPGGQAGTTVEARLGGYDWTPDTQFFVLDERVGFEVLGPPGEMLHPGPPHWFGPKARNKPFAVPREVPVRFTLPADLPPGVIRWQAANANGSTSIGEFVVGGTPEVSEEQLQVNDSSLPAAPWVLSGRLEKKEEVDRYTWRADRTGLVTCRFQTHRFGFPFHPVLRVRDDSGTVLVDQADTTGSGLAATFSATSGKRYELTVHDIDYAGNRALIYRLSLSEGPRVAAAMPPAGVRGQKQKVRFIGYGLASGRPRLEEVERTVELPADAEATHWLCTFETDAGEQASFRLELTDVPQSVRPASSSDAGNGAAGGNSSGLEGENTADNAPSIAAPAAVTGRLMRPGREDAYRLTAAKGDRWTIRLEARRIGSPLDVAYRILNEQGKQVASADDSEGTTDAVGEFLVPADGEYRIVVSDLSGRTGRLDSLYRLSVTRPEPAFALELPDALDIPIGATAALNVRLARTGGLADAVRLTFSGLPEGVSVEGDAVIPAGKDQAKITLQAGETATSYASLARVEAVAVDAEGKPLSATATRQLLVAPVMKPRAVVAPLYRDAGRTVHRGATYAAPVVLERLEGFEGEVVLQMAARPDRIRQGILGDDLVVPPGVTSAEFPLFLPEWVQTDRTSRIILNTLVQVPDPRGNVRYLLNKMDKRITMNVEGALLKLTPRRAEFEVAEGQTVEIPLSISRSPKLDGEVRLEVVEPAGWTGTAEPLTLPTGQGEATLRLRCRALPPGVEQPVTLQATVWPRTDLPVISRAQVVLIARPATAAAAAGSEAD